MNFQEAFARLLGNEGGLSMDPNDRGNWTGGKVGVGQLRGTKYGISAATYPNEDIARLTMDRAAFLYGRDFYGPAGCDAMPDAAKFDVFDMAVNSGVKAAIKTAQQAAGATPDGVLGPLTLQAVQSMPAAVFKSRFNGIRLGYMASLDAWQDNGRGWARRIASNLLS